MVFLQSVPHLTVRERITFPEVQTDEEIAAVGGNLSPGMLLSAYEQGLFPWYNPGEPVIWWDPADRMILPVGKAYISRRMKRLRRKARFRITFDTCFDAVIRSCADAPRKDQDGTWIDSKMIEAYIRLHREGFAHSVEAWDGTHLAGGLYGVSLGKAFFGESMFSRIPDSSKLCFYELHDWLGCWGFQIIDCQIYSVHMQSLGAYPVTRQQFKTLLKKALQEPGLTGCWDYFSG